MRPYCFPGVARPFLSAVAAFLISVLAMAQTNNFVVEAPIGAVPLDLEITPNGSVAVVRGRIPSSILPSDQKVSLWATGTSDPTKVQIIPTPANTVGQGNLPVAATGLPLFSDAIAVTNERVIAIGSAMVATTAGENTTYVDILAISQTTDPPTATVLQTHVLGGGTTWGLTAGLAHDVAITPDGALAVVSHRNWIHVFRMADGQQVGQLNIGGVDSPGGKGFCDPGDSHNSVAVTNSRAVVTARRPAPGYPSAHRTWVYILDLTQHSDPVIRLEHNVGEVVNSPHSDTSPHDLAISPNGQRAVVTTNRMVALYDLVTNTVLGPPHQEPLWERDWNGVGADLWDSVEVSDTRAVVLSSPPWGEPQVDKFIWHVHVFGIDGGSLNLLQQYKSSYPIEGFQDWGWDVALSDDGQYATVKTLTQDVALLDLETRT